MRHFKVNEKGILFILKEIPDGASWSRVCP